MGEAALKRPHDWCKCNPLVCVLSSAPDLERKWVCYNHLSQSLGSLAQVVGSDKYPWCRAGKATTAEASGVGVARDVSRMLLHPGDSTSVPCKDVHLGCQTQTTCAFVTAGYGRRTLIRRARHGVQWVCIRHALTNAHAHTNRRLFAEKCLNATNNWCDANSLPGSVWEVSAGWLQTTRLSQLDSARVVYRRSQAGVMMQHH